MQPEETVNDATLYRRCSGSALMPQYLLSFFVIHTSQNGHEKTTAEGGHTRAITSTTVCITSNTHIFPYADSL
jgi:hypothetical protein